MYAPHYPHHAVTKGVLSTSLMEPMRTKQLRGSIKGLSIDYIHVRLKEIGHHLLTGLVRPTNISTLIHIVVLHS